MPLIERLATLDYAAGIVLILSFVALAVGATLYWVRGGIRGGAPPTQAYLLWERGSIIAAVVLTALGLALLDGYLQSTNGRVLARIGAATYFVGAVLVVAAEASTASQGLHQNWPRQDWALTVTYVVLAYVGQAAVGASLVQAGVVPAWIGWTAVVWNLGLLVVSIVKRGDIYIPFLHHMMPLLIGIGLVARPG